MGSVVSELVDAAVTTVDLPRSDLDLDPTGSLMVGSGALDGGGSGGS